MQAAVEDNKTAYVDGRALLEAVSSGALQLDVPDYGTAYLYGGDWAERIETGSVSNGGILMIVWIPKDSPEYIVFYPFASERSEMDIPIDDIRAFCNNSLVLDATE